MNPLGVTPSTRRRVLAAALVLAAAFVLVPGAGPRASFGAAPPPLIAASDPRFLYEGRFDFANRSAPVAIWQGSRIRMDFEGAALGLRFGEPTDQCFFNADIDGTTSVVELRRGSAPKGAAISGLGAGRHSLVLFKRSEASAGAVPFLGVDLAEGARAWAPRTPAYRLAMEFIGDSITAGACDEDGPHDQWDDRRTHNSALSYAALTAEAFAADCRNIAVSGMGVAAGWVGVTAGDVWDALYPRADSPRADTSLWRPDVVLVNLGENDDSFPRAHHQPFPPGYTRGYVSLVRAIRRAYPEAEIVMLRGGMFGGARSAELRSAWEAAVSQVEAGDSRACHFAFGHWSLNHPRAVDHRAMANELESWLKAQPFMRPYL
jgi:lysophospholipase L1-like esterase